MTSRILEACGLEQDRSKTRNYQTWKIWKQ